MIKKYFTAPLFLFLLLTSCNGKKTPEKEENTEKMELLKTSIAEIDDSLQKITQIALMEEQYVLNKAVYFEAINRNKDFFFHFPQDPFSEKALNKIAAIFLQLDLEEEAVKWRDTLLHHFPNTDFKPGLLELQMSFYGAEEHFDKNKVEYYGNKILEIEDLPEEKRKEIEFRLENSDKTLFQLIEMQLEQ